MQARRRAEVARGWLLATIAAIVVLDQLTKLTVVRAIPQGGSRPLVGDWLAISHFRNPGAAFGLLRGFGGLLALAAVIGALVFGVIVLRRPPGLRHRWVGVGAALVSGGALGNLGDRLFRGPFGRGAVVDFFDLSFWPAFNVADSAITVGAALFILSGFREGSREDDAHDRP